MLLVRYRVDDSRVEAYEATFVPIEWLDWSCLTLGALGHGQLQIKDASVIRVREQARSEWMRSFCDAVLAFYGREQQKLEERIVELERIRDRWRGRT